MVPPLYYREANIVKPWQFERPSQPQKFDIALNYMGTKDLLDRLLQVIVNYELTCIPWFDPKSHQNFIDFLYWGEGGG